MISKLALFALLVSLVASGAERSAAFVFGPEGAENSQDTARAAAGAARRLLAAPGTTLEVWSAGSGAPQTVESGLPARAFDPIFPAAARAGRDATAILLLSSLDAAAQALARKPGERALVAILESPPLSTEADSLLRQLTEYCRSLRIRVLVFDPAARAARDVPPAWRSLAEETGGKVIRSGRELENTLMISPPGAGAVPAATQPGTVASPSTMPGELAVQIRFLRTSSNRSTSWGTQRSYSSGGGPAGGGITTREGGPNAETGTGVLRGMLLVEAPLRDLQFDIDDNAGVYQAKALITQIVRNAKGEVVWQAKKSIVIRGPLTKLKMRQQGSLFFSRNVQLPAGRYTLEGLIEDQLANKSGGIRQPLQTGDGIPGFQVSDAVMVRPFNGSADRFEADDIFSYDGEALSPMLAPAFDEATPVDLRLYLVLYPDLFGGQPELTLELLRNGRPVGQARLPFTDAIRDTTREGIGSSKGEQKTQFPYLATLKGARLSAGSYEARITVKQGRNVITRSVPFRVTGKEPVDVAIDTAGSSGAPAEPVAVEEAPITFPEVNPVEINRTETAPEPEEQKRYWEEAAQNAAGFSKALPNFRCQQETRKLTAPVKDPDRFRESDVLIADLLYENGRETYQLLEVNGLKASRGSQRSLGVSSRGEFGTMLRSLFSPEVAATYRWAGRALIGNSLCRVFEIQVKAEKSNFVLTHNLRQEVAGYRGRVFVDEESGLVRQLTIQGEGLPKDFALKSPVLSLEYGLVRVGPQDHLLPLRSILQLQQGRSLVRNETTFRNYRRFEAESQIRY